MQRKLIQLISITTCFQDASFFFVLTRLALSSASVSNSADALGSKILTRRIRPILLFTMVEVLVAIHVGVSVVNSNK